ncbi:hypothetical protein J4E80_010853 [Alternaria sp. BMP 0032]|nr:hypothetical protein J4E80_010853 [Alternaria sp. BMP 0032]
MQIRPSVNHYRAILFDADEAKPRFIWLLCKWLEKDDDEDEDDGLEYEYEEDDEENYQMPMTKAIIGDDTSASHTPIQHNSRLDIPLSDTIFVTYRDTFSIDGSRPNKSVASITSTQPGTYTDWRGPIVAYAKVGRGTDPPTCRHLDMVDFRHVTDYFLSHGYTPPKAQANVARVKGVRINCLGDVKMLKRPPFEAIELPTTDPIFTKHDTSDIADRIGIPILTRRCPPGPKWANKSGDEMFEHSSPTNNQNATFLHQCLDPNAEFDFSTGSMGWGLCSMPWQMDVGSAIVVRKDRKPLLPLQMEALAKWCKEEVRPILAHSIGEYAPEEPISKEDVLTIICRPMFVVYWTRFTSERKDYETPSPYDGSSV